MEPAILSRIYKNVVLGENTIIHFFSIIGEPPRGKSAGELETRIGKNGIVRSHSVIYAGNVIGDEFQAGHGVLIRELNKVGHKVSIGSHSVIEHHVEIEDDVRIHSNVFVPEYSVLEKGSWVGPNAVFTNAPYPLSSHAKLSLKGPRLRRGAKVGANVTLLPGVVIGRNALIGAGAVVVRDVPDGKIAIGNPARVIKDISDIPDYQELLRLEKDLLGA